MLGWYLADMGSWAKEQAKVAKWRGTVIRVRTEIELGGDHETRSQIWKCDPIGPLNILYENNKTSRTAQSGVM